MRQATTAASSSPESAGGDAYARYRFLGNAFALVVVVAAIVEIIANARHPIPRDFVSFWGAAQLALAGNPAAAYDNAALHVVQAAVANFGDSGAQMPFPYPPAYLLLVLPFGLMPFPLGMAAWSLCTLAFYLYAARKLLPGSGWLPAAFPAVYANAAVGQNGFLTAGILMAGLSLLSRRPFAAGLVLGCLVIKPQLALLLPVALLAARSWRAVVGGALSAIAIMLAGLLIFGFAATAAWLSQLPLYAAITRDGLVGWSKLASIYAAARQFGADPAVALALNGAVAIAAAAAVWRIWRSTVDEGPKAAILCAAAGLASPYMLFYDAVCLVPAFLWLMRHNERPAVLLALWCLPLLQIVQIGTVDTGLNLNALAPLATTILVYRRWRLGNSERADSSPPSLMNRQPSPITLS